MATSNYATLPGTVDVCVVLKYVKQYPHVTIQNFHSGTTVFDIYMCLSRRNRESRPMTKHCFVPFHLGSRVHFWQSEFLAVSFRY